MKIARAIKAHEPNINSKTIITNLEDKLKEFIDNNSEHVFVDNKTGFDLDTDILDKFTVDLSKVTCVVFGFDDEYFYVNLTDFGEKIFKIDDNRTIANYKMGIIYTVDDETKSICNKIIRLCLIKNKEEN